LRLTKFRGQDYGKSQFTKEDQYEKLEFPPNIKTLKQIFTPIDQLKDKNMKSADQTPKGASTTTSKVKKRESQNFTTAAANAETACEEPEKILTAMGELVYLRSPLEFKDKQKSKWQSDTVIEENLLDVKRLLKNSAFSAQ
jgi:hypothetical protein